MNQMATPAPEKATPALPDAQEFTDVQHYTDRLFSFRTGSQAPGK